MENIYFDNAATTKLDEKVLDAMLPYLKENYGNASSIYKLGREARKAIEETREKIESIREIAKTSDEERQSVMQQLRLLNI